jgi:hypothetical protein
LTPPLLPPEDSWALGPLFVCVSVRWSCGLCK